MPGFFDVAEPSWTSPSRSEQSCLRQLGQPQHSEQCVFRRSTALPTSAPADASPAPSRERPHGSGRGMDWLLPLPQRTFTSCPWPVSLAHPSTHYWAVRLPGGVHERLIAHRFPFPAGGFLRHRHRRDLLVPRQEVSRHALRFFDSAEPDALLRWRSRPCGIPHALTASVLESKRFRASIALPVCAPVYASRPGSRPAPQDSGSGWLARPSLYDSFIRDFLLVSPAHQDWSLAPHLGRHSAVLNLGFLSADGRFGRLDREHGFWAAILNSALLGVFATAEPGMRDQFLGT